MYGDVLGWGSDRYFLNKKQILLGMTRNLSIGAVYGKKNPTIFKVAEKTIGRSLPTSPMGEIPPSSSESTLDQWLMSLDRLLKDQ